MHKITFDKTHAIANLKNTCNRTINRFMASEQEAHFRYQQYNDNTALSHGDNGSLLWKLFNTDRSEWSKDDWAAIALYGIPIVGLLSPMAWSLAKKYLTNRLFSTRGNDASASSSDAGRSIQENAGTVPGERAAVETISLSTLSKQWQQGTFAPIQQIHQHLCAFHLYAHNPSRDIIAHHYCTCVNEEMHQCLIYDSCSKTAKLIGIEYIISERLFQQLPAEEKKLWHSHAYEVTSGQLVQVGVPDMLETQVLRKIARTYGKTWHTWQVDRGDTLPIGLPQLMMSYTRDGQLGEALVAKRDSEIGCDTKHKREYRERNMSDVLDGFVKDPNADAWTWIDDQESELSLSLGQQKDDKRAVQQSSGP